MDTSLEWHVITNDPLSIQWPENNMLEFEIAGKQIALAKWNDQYWAFNAKCPHANGRMAQGYINNQGYVICPLHHYSFSIKNGRNPSLEGFLMKTYPVEVRSEGIFVGFKPISSL
jgi:3-phenylpropionate/trans-cinnamate dioxygenase ferredoxin subunit